MAEQALDKRIVRFVQAEFKSLADPAKAGPMAAYMKTEMPFYGIQKPDRLPIYRVLKQQYKPTSQQEYEACVLALWKLKYREEKYTAIEYASFFPQYIAGDSLGLFEQLVREGQWWDFVDPIAIVLVGGALKKERTVVEPVLDKWINDSDMWIRRTAILAQNHHKAATNEKKLFAYCLLRAHEKEFFIRKAIGWALREYSYASPNAVAKFIEENKTILSPLSQKEGAKQLMRQRNK